MKILFFVLLVATFAALAFSAEQKFMRVVIRDKEPPIRTYMDKDRSYILISKPKMTVLANGKDKTTYFLKHDQNEILALKDDYDASKDKPADYLKKYLADKDGIDHQYKKAQESDKASKLDLSDHKKEQSFQKVWQTISKTILFRPNDDYKKFLARVDDSFKLINNYLRKIYKSNSKPFLNSRSYDDYFEYEILLVSLLKKYKDGEKVLFNKPIQLDLNKIYQKQILPDGVFELVAEIAKKVDIKKEFPNTSLASMVNLSKQIAISQKACKA